MESSYWLLGLLHDAQTQKNKPISYHTQTIGRIMISTAMTDRFKDMFPLWSPPHSKLSFGFGPGDPRVLFLGCASLGACSHPPPIHRVPAICGEQWTILRTTQLLSDAIHVRKTIWSSHFSRLIYSKKESERSSTHHELHSICVCGQQWLG